jgi:hypothetical protein
MTTQHSEDITLRRYMRKVLLNLGLRNSSGVLDMIEEFEDMLEDEPIRVPSQAFINPRLFEQLLKPRT